MGAFGLDRLVRSVNIGIRYANDDEHLARIQQRKRLIFTEIFYVSERSLPGKRFLIARIVGEEP